jgi:hypothetical protein
MKKAGIIAGLFFARHPGAGRDPVALPSECAKKLQSELWDAFTTMRHIATGFRPAPE